MHYVDSSPVSLVSFHVNQRQLQPFSGEETAQVYSNNKPYQFEIKFTLNIQVDSFMKIYGIARSCFSLYSKCSFTQETKSLEQINEKFWQTFLPRFTHNGSIIHLIFERVLFNQLELDSADSYSLAFGNECLIKDFVIMNHDEYSELTKEFIDLKKIAAIKKAFRLVRWVQTNLNRRIFQTCKEISTENKDLKDPENKKSFIDELPFLYESRKFSLKFQQYGITRFSNDGIPGIMTANEPFEFFLDLLVDKPKVGQAEIETVASFLRLKQASQETALTRERFYHFNYLYRYSIESSLLRLTYLLRFNDSHLFSSNNHFPSFQICFNRVPLTTLPIIVTQNAKERPIQFLYKSRLPEQNAASTPTAVVKTCIPSPLSASPQTYDSYSFSNSTEEDIFARLEDAIEPGEIRSTSSSIWELDILQPMRTESAYPADI